MFDLNPETVALIIDKARQFQFNEASVAPEDSGSMTDDRATQILSEYSDQPVMTEMTGTIDDLEPDQQATLVALMWLGRGDYLIDEWDQAVADANERWTPHTESYLFATPMLADYLLEGLSLHGYDSV